MAAAEDPADSKAMPKAKRTTTNTEVPLLYMEDSLLKSDLEQLPQVRRDVLRIDAEGMGEVQIAVGVHDVAQRTVVHRIPDGRALIFHLFDVHAVVLGDPASFFQ